MIGRKQRAGAPKSWVEVSACVEPSWAVDARGTGNQTKHLNQRQSHYSSTCTSIGTRDSTLPTGRGDVCICYEGRRPRRIQSLGRLANYSPLTHAPPLPHSIIGLLLVLCYISIRGAQRLRLYPPFPLTLFPRPYPRPPQDVKQREAERRRTVVTPTPHFVTGTGFHSSTFRLSLTHLCP